MTITLSERKADIKRLKALASGNESGDREDWHVAADNILKKYAPPEIQEAYDEVPKWYA